MTVGSDLQQMSHEQIGRFGDGLQIVLRERSTLRTRTSGTPTNSPTLVGAASAGDTEIVAEAMNLSGTIPAGAQITLGGVEYSIATTASANVTTGRIALTLEAPGLTANIAAGSAIDVSQPNGDTTYVAMRSRLAQKDGADGVPDEARAYRLSALKIDGTPQTRRPKKGDVLLDADGSATLLVTEVTGPEPGETAIHWTITVGGAK